MPIDAQNATTDSSRFPGLLPLQGGFKPGAQSLTAGRTPSRPTLVTRTGAFTVAATTVTDPCPVQLSNN
jgi:hypothetical protein